ncbi:MAG: uroporphyrinogen-III synthase [Methanomicrobiales archaeon]|nr:uroporphyrinogen-III synthase [Methanomicrobiales archaeon]NYT21369.1 uroporphyrinogen-III synthase [Methanomicrobiales archaeon]
MNIAVTRLAGKETGDAARCRAFGHHCYAVAPLRAEIRQDLVTSFVEAVEENRYDCLFFSSALPAQIIAPRLSRWPRVVAIGPQTAKTLQHFGIECEILPRYYSSSFVPYLGEWIRGKRIGIPRADVPNPGLIGAIRTAGGIPEEIRVYSLIPTREALDLGDAGAVLFTSAMSFEQAVWKRRTDLLLMAIGESTASAMKRRGVVPSVTGDGSLEGTLRALNGFLAEDSGRAGFS